jgi:phosphoribosylamine---glycine ligase
MYFPTLRNNIIIIMRHRQPLYDLINVLIVGSGGREHALGWKLSQNGHIKKIFYAPGNAGTLQNVKIQTSEIDKLKIFAKENHCFTIVGPECPLANGIVDSFLESELEIFGPTKSAALLESSKGFAKKFMHENGIPTPSFQIFSDAEKAKDHVTKQKNDLVIKADGLASGKGVVICNNSAQAVDAIDNIMEKKQFGRSGDSIVIEEKLSGEECSFIVICDGKTVIPLSSSQDHKRIFDNDKGPNTGGMGSFSPTPLVDEDLYDTIMKQIMCPVVKRMKERGNLFKGFLYAGIMVEQQTKKPYVLEFNARMGDPECQSILMRMESDLFKYLESASHEKLDSMPPIEWKNKFAVCVTMASRGYPGRYVQGHPIKGLNYNFGNDVMVFHSGTQLDMKNRIVNSGGRVLAVTALGCNIRMTIHNAYSAVQRISWGRNEHYYRKDIAMRYSNVNKQACCFP